MDFPHLKDTQFPLIDNVNVYKYQNNFDYARWNGKVSFKLLNVLWNSNYADVPYFENDSDRDSWFNEKEGYVGTLETLFNSTPENTIRIPIPYNDAYRYNYLVVDLPMQTSEINPLNYEDSDIRVKRWFYFIDDMVQLSPSTTEMIVSVDYWTTFIHSVEIPYLMLERGHAPMVQTSVDTYLANPLANNEYLLADDFNYGRDTIITKTEYKPINNGKKYVLFCAPYSGELFDLFGAEEYSGSSTAPTYSDTEDRYGYQYQVNNYRWTYGGTDYSNAQMPIRNQVQSGILDGCECFAIEAQYARAFFNKVAIECVHFIHGIKAMFILDENLFERSNNTISFKGYTIYRADQKHNINNFSFSKAQFNYDNKYKEITKLYTSPYAQIEVTDDEGNSFIAKIENCGNVQMHTMVSLIYPYLNYNVFFTGINGNGSVNYTWMNVTDDVANRNMWESDFSKFMMNWNVPTYAIYVSAKEEYAALNNINMQAQRARAIMEYQNAMRLNNTNKENIDDVQTQIYNNIVSLTDTQYDNIERSEGGTIDNMELTRQTNEDIVNDLQYAIGAPNNDWDGGTGGFYRRSLRSNLKKLTMDSSSDVNFMQAAQGLSQDYISATSAVSEGTTIAGGWINGAASFGNGLANAENGGLVSGTTGLISNVANGYVQANAIHETNLALISKEFNTIYAQLGYYSDKFSNSTQYGWGTLGIKEDYDKAVLQKQMDLLEDTTRKFSDSWDAQSGDGINLKNADDMRNTQQTNSLALTNTEKDNADYSRTALMENEKAVLVQKQLEMESLYKNEALRKPVEYSGYSGDFGPDAYKRRGVRFNIRTQSKSAIAQAGDAFLRFGYALHRVWDMSDGFNYCNHFTFWKAEDIWINDGTGVANAATKAIGDILLKGVTVWSNPDEIGTVGIYNNI